MWALLRSLLSSSHSSLTHFLLAVGQRRVLAVDIDKPHVPHYHPFSYLTYSPCIRILCARCKTTTGSASSLAGGQWKIWSSPCSLFSILDGKGNVRRGSSLSWSPSLRVKQKHSCHGLVSHPAIIMYHRASSIYHPVSLHLIHHISIIMTASDAFAHIFYRSPYHVTPLLNLSAISVPL